MEDGIVDKVIEELKTLGGQIGDLAEETFRIYVHQAFIEGVYGSVWAIVALLLFFTGVVLCCKWARKAFARGESLNEHKVHCKERYPSDMSHERHCPGAQDLKDPAECGVPSAISGVVAAIAFLVFAFNAPDILQIINPEYYAIQDLIQQVRSGS